EPAPARGDIEWCVSTRIRGLNDQQRSPTSSKTRVRPHVRVTHGLTLTEARLEPASFRESTVRIAELAGFAGHAARGVEQFQFGGMKLMLHNEGAVLDAPQALAGAQRREQG